MSQIDYLVLGKAVAAAIEGADDSQLTREQLKTMTREQILEAQAAGRLDDLLNAGRRKRHPAGDGRANAEDLAPYLNATKELTK